MALADGKEHEQDDVDYDNMNSGIWEAYKEDYQNYKEYFSNLTYEEIQNISQTALTDFVLTGSGVYGPQVPGKSDIDIVLMWGDVAMLEGFLVTKGIQTNRLRPCSLSFYFQLGFLKINIIGCADEEVYNTWKIRTAKMKLKQPIEDRELRIATFRSLYPEQDSGVTDEMLEDLF